jgi:predicted ArsR family transcriptional regulator
MLEALFGNQNIERVLFYLLRNGEAYPSAMASAFGSSTTPIQRQLARLEAGNVVASRLVGRTRVYQINPRYPFKKELDAFLEKAFKALPDVQVQKIYSRRSRPRRPGKPS